MAERHAHPAAFSLSVLLNGVLVTLQLVIGFGFGSLALIGDALHNLGDVVGLLLAWGAEGLARRPPSRRFTYGFGRSTQFAALANAALVMGAGAIVVLEGVQRLGRPVALGTTPVALAALAGLVVNLGSARLFGEGHHHDLNRRAAVMHLLSDAALSATVLLSTLLIAITGWTPLDAIVAIGVGGLVVLSGLRVLREAVEGSLDAVPSTVDLEAVERSLRAIEGVCDVHHLHVWSVSTSRVALTAHLCRDPAAVNDAHLLRQAQQQLRDLGVDHATLQLEPATGIGCDQPVVPR